MKQESFKARHPIAHKLLLATGFTAIVTTGALVVPRLANKLSACMIKNSVSVDISEEGPEIVRNDSANEQ